MKTIINDIKKIPILMLCFMVFAIGIWLTKEANIGLSPWNCFNDGLTNYTNFTFGQLTQIVGLVVILIATLLKMYIGIGTILNIIFIGYFIDVLDSNIIINNQNIFISYIMCILGSFIVAFGFVFYVKQGLGQGPRDSLNQGIYNKLNVKYGYVKFTIEGIVLVIGILLGGSYGIGTVLLLFTTSFFTQQLLHFFNVEPKTIKNNYIHTYLKLLATNKKVEVK